MRFNEKNNGITEANLYEAELTDFPKKEVEYFMHYPGKLLISMAQVHSRNNKVRKMREWAKLKLQWVRQKCYCSRLDY